MSFFFQKMEAKPRTCKSQQSEYQSDDKCLSTQEILILNDLRENGQLCDAVLRLDDGGTFRVHRAILSMCSTYFRFVWLLMWLTEDRTQQNFIT
jgi:hypothetical protein